jgi:hypothetical protein
MFCSFIPPYVLRQLTVANDEALHEHGRATLLVDERMRSRRRSGPVALRRIRVDTDRRIVHDAENAENLPGRVARRDADPVTGDSAVDEAWDSSGAVWDLFETRFDRRSVDGEGSTLSITVHYGTNYDNAFWDGRQLVFGDGDGLVFERFTKPMDVMAHEFTHGVIQYTANLDYEGQSGALNESVADVFAALTKQRGADQTADQANWLIGEGLFGAGVDARALRSMIDPGTAYDDPRLGRDPQVGSMIDYVDTEDDNGGVHINSGIPNRAFALAAIALGGPSWERAGRCWYDTLTAGEVTERTDFAGFAAATVSSAQRLFGDDPAVAQAVVAGWAEVGVLAGGAVAVTSGPAEAGPAEPGAVGPEVVGPGAEGVEPPLQARRVAVRRTGGFAGTVRTGELDAAADPLGSEVWQLLTQVDSAGLPERTPQPDRFIYTVEFGQTRMQVPEQDLTPELQRVVQIVLGYPDDLTLE